MNELEKMLAGEFCNGGAPEIQDIRKRAQQILHDLNHSEEKSEIRAPLCHALFGAFGEDSHLSTPFICELGHYISIGKKCYINFNVTILDLNRVTIGDYVLIAPNVQIYTATHSLDHRLRQNWALCSQPITIGDHAWIGGGAIVGPGVTIGQRSIVGAGAVVMRDVPDDVVVAGNPAKVLRHLQFEPLPSV